MEKFHFEKTLIFFKSKFFKLENFQNRNLPSTFFIELFHRHFSSRLFIENFRRNFSSKFFKSKIFKIDFLHDKIIFFGQDFFYLKVWIVSFDSAGSRTPIWWEYGLLEFYLSVLRIEWIESVKYFIHCLWVYARARPKCGLPLRQRILWKSGILPPP